MTTLYNLRERSNLRDTIQDGDLAMRRRDGVLKSVDRSYVGLACSEYVGRGRDWAVVYFEPATEHDEYHAKYTSLLLALHSALHTEPAPPVPAPAPALLGRVLGIDLLREAFPVGVFVYHRNDGARLRVVEHRIRRGWGTDPGEAQVRVRTRYGGIFWCPANKLYRTYDLPDGWRWLGPTEDLSADTHYCSAGGEPTSANDYAARRHSGAALTAWVHDNDPFVEGIGAAYFLTFRYTIGLPDPVRGSGRRSGYCVRLAQPLQLAEDTDDND